MPTVPTVIDVRRRGIVLGGVLLGDEQDLLVVLHHLFQRLDRFLAADEERHDHVGEHHNVAQRQYGIERAAGGFDHSNPSVTRGGKTLAAEIGRIRARTAMAGRSDLASMAD